MFSLAISDKIISESPVTRKEKRRKKPNRLTPSWEDFQKIVQQIRNNQFSGTAQASADLIEFMGPAGLGNAECDKLAWGDIDFEQGKIEVYRVKSKTGFKIPIYPLLRPLLERLHGQAFSMGQAGHADKVFAVRDAKKSLATACMKLGLPA